MKTFAVYEIKVAQILKFVFENIVENREIAGIAVFSLFPTMFF